MADKSAQNVIDSIRRPHAQAVAAFVCARHPNIGENSSELLAERFGTLEAVKSATVAEIEGIHDLAKRVNGASGVARRRNQSAPLAKLLDAGVHPSKSRRSKPTRALPESFVFTGTMTRERRELEEMVKDKGGASRQRFQKTDYVVAGDAAGSKLDKARETRCRF
jgi:DNA ligase (NAD+)